jgi:ribonuclease Z
MRRLFASAVLLATIAVGAFALLWRSEGLQDRLVDAVIARRAVADRTDLLSPDHLDLVFCGTGSPMPDPQRGAACIAVFVGDRVFLIDSGPGSFERVARYRLPTGKLVGVLLTHFHSDHVGGLGEIVLNSWTQGRAKPLFVYGGKGVEDVVRGFQDAYAADSRYRIAHHGTELLPPDGARMQAVPVTLLGGDGVVPILDEGDLRIVAFRVQHPPVSPAYGYRIDYKGRSVIFSGDTMPTTAMSEVGKGVDVMVHEAVSSPLMHKVADRLERTGDPRRAQLLRDAIDYHTPPVAAAEIANAAGARLLVYSHVIPPLPNRIAERVFLRGVEAVRPRGTVVGYDGLRVTLPVGSTEIRIADLN